MYAVHPENIFPTLAIIRLTRVWSEFHNNFGCFVSMVGNGRNKTVIFSF
jgi:hypothetical protein